MATFKVGDKVRIKKTANFEPAARCFLGAEAVIVGDGLLYEWKLNLFVGGEPLGANSSALEPLTDPGAERFIERIKRLGKEPVNDAPKVEVLK